MLRLIVRYLKFSGTSAIGTVVDILVLWLLSDVVFDGRYWGEYVISPAISFQCAVAVNFLMSYFYVWKDRIQGRQDVGMKLFVRLYLAYNLSCSSVFLLRMGVLLLIERFAGWDVVVCNLVAMCVSGILNFMISGLVVFKAKN